MISMGKIIAQRLHDVVLDGELGLDYTFDKERDKNQILRTKYVVTDAMMRIILLKIDESHYIKSEKSTNEEHYGDTVHVFKINEVNISGSMYQVTLPIKFTIFVIIAAMLVILFIFIRYYKNKLRQEDLSLFHLSILSVVAIELTVTMFLTPYWLQSMYGIPFFASQFVRILKSCVMIPLGIIIVYTMNRMIQKVIK